MTEQSALTDQQKFEQGKHDGLSHYVQRSQLNGPEQPYTQGAITGLVENFASIVHSELSFEQFYLHHQEYGSSNESFTMGDNGFKTEIDFVSQVNSFDAMATATSSTEFKEALPELALLDLSRNFSAIHDSHLGDTMTLADLQDYEKRCHLEPTKALAVTYAINHFDMISKTFGDGTGITKKTLANGIDFFDELEQQRSAFNKKAELLPELIFLNQKFDEIHKTEPNFPGISLFELTRFREKNCSDSVSRDAVDKVIKDFDSLSRLNTNDGDRLWLHALGLWHGNADGITRADIASGMQKVNQPSDFGIKFDPWTK